MYRHEKIEAVSYELLRECAKKGLTIEEMHGLAAAFPRAVRKEINTFESSAVFTLNSAQDVQR